MHYDRNEHGHVMYKNMTILTRFKKCNTFAYEFRLKWPLFNKEKDQGFA